MSPHSHSHSSPSSAQPRAIVLLSGGLDSAVCLAMVLKLGYRAQALSFDYGQRHRAELVASERIAAFHKVERRVIQIDLRQFGQSALTDDIPVPKHALEPTSIPVTYVPARNTIFLAYALACAEVESASIIVIGVNAIDYSGYPDCRPEFIAAFQSLADVATKKAVEGNRVAIETPLIGMTKAEIIRRGHSLGVDFALSVSCYDSDSTGAACGECDSCLLRKKGFVDANIADPTRYRPHA